MNDLMLHLGLFLLASTAIVAVTTAFAEPEDGAAWRAFPRRWLRFQVGCGAVLGVLLLMEHTVASLH